LPTIDTQLLYNGEKVLSHRRW